MSFLNTQAATLGILFAGLAALAGGCGPTRPATAPVSGTVTLDGRPVALAEVMFVPRAGGRPASATTDEAGRFQLSTFAADDGALLGEHGVAIAKAIRRDAPTATGATPGPMADPTQFSEAKIEFLLPSRYASIQTSTLSATVERGENTFQFDLTTREAK